MSGQENQTQSSSTIAEQATSNNETANSTLINPNQVTSTEAYYSEAYSQAYANTYNYGYLAYTDPVTGLSYQQANPYATYAQQQQYMYANYPYYQATSSVQSSLELNKNALDPSKLQQKTKNDNSKLEEDTDEEDFTIDHSRKSTKANNILPNWGNEKTMNLNQLILTNILQSPYFKVNLYQLKTYHEVIDEIYYQVKHLEPWERGSRKISGQTGMCGSVRGVGAGGIVSTPFCILYKLYTLKLTRKQLVGLLKHKDSSFIRALGFMYIRYTQPPNTFWDWFEPYLQDEEEVEVKSGVVLTIGEIVRHMITKLDWYSTLFPRMPIPVQKDLEKKLKEYDKKLRNNRKEKLEDGELDEDEHSPKRKISPFSKRNRRYSTKNRSRSRSRSLDRERDHSRRNKDKSRRSRSRSRDRYRKDDRRRHR